MADEGEAILLAAETAGTAVRGLVALAKARNPRVSLAGICRRAGIGSKGYLADILSGRRLLNPKYADGLGKALGLKTAGARLLRLLAEADAKGLPTEEAVKLQEHIAVSRRSLSVSRRPLPSELARMSLAFEVYCSFGLFGNRPTEADLIRYFGEREREGVEAALALLARHDLIERAGDAYVAKQTGIIFGAGGKGFEHVDFLRASLRDADRNLKRWFDARDESYIESLILSVRRSDYLRLLPLIRERLLEARSRMDVEDADMLIRFNVQIYPVRASRE